VTKRPIHLKLNRRTLRAILGMIWLLDGLLQLQPGMWTMDMVTSVMQPTNSGQPGPIHAFLTWATNIVSAHLIPVNAYIAGIQILIGLALTLNILPRVAILVSVIHALAVWVVGEGMSGLLTGQALFLMGVPGAVLIYVVLGVAAWPKPGDEDASLPASWLRYALGAVWLLAAALQLQPDYLAPTGLSGAIGGMASGQPAPLHNSIEWVASRIGSHGLELTLGLAAFQLALALGVLLAQDMRPWLVLSAIWALIAWWFGQAVGMLFTGMGTDPQVSPLIILLVVAVWFRQRNPLPGTLVRMFGG
jgi:hypothetical protein